MGKTLPCVRDYDNHIYLRRWRNSFLMGAFEPKARAWKVGDALRPRTHTPGVECDWTEISQEHWSVFLKEHTKDLTKLSQYYS